MGTATAFSAWAGQAAKLADGERRELFSVWWSGLAGAGIDLKRDRIVLNGMSAWLLDPAFELFRQEGVRQPFH
jgi:hypothetical protein